MIEPGKLIEFLGDSESALVMRVLYVDQYGTNAAVIDVDSPSAEPVWRQVSELNQRLATSKAHILEVDHALPPMVPEDELLDSDKEFRDRAWASIAPLFEGENKILMLYPRDRARLIRQRVKETNVTRKTLYKRARRYWQRGQTPNTQIPQYRNCGGNKERKVTKKLGRRSLLSKAEKRTIGINIDSKRKDIIVRGSRLFYENIKGATLEQAYRKTLARFCNKGYELVNGIKTPILPNVEGVPTVGQFKYWAKKDADGRLRRLLISRNGERSFNLRYRECLGDSTKEAFGPGSLFQIDATPADVYLVSRFNPNDIIRRVVIHAIIDVFSRMIVGISVRPEPEGWLGVMLAIQNATVDKVAFCAEYGLSIDKDKWEASCLPERLLGDRGPLEGYNADNLVHSLNISIENTPPYRADWKGIIERTFRMFNDKLIHRLPGAVDRKRERGEKDYRLDAALNIYELTQLLLKLVIHHNNHHRMDWYEMDEFLIRDEVEPYPADLFRWGVANRQGLLRSGDPEMIRTNLLPSDRATITERGIRFRGREYLCEQATREDWHLKARNRGRWDMRAAYDPRTTNVIFLRPGDGRPSIVCRLKNPDSAFRNSDWSEFESYSENKKVKGQRAITRGLQSDIAFDAIIDDAVSKVAERKKHALVPGQSKRSRTKDIRAHGQAEASAIHGAEIIQLYGASASIPTVGTEGDEPDFDYVPFPQPTNVRSIRERRMRGGQTK